MLDFLWLGDGALESSCTDGGLLRTFLFLPLKFVVWPQRIPKMSEKIDSKWKRSHSRIATVQTPDLQYF